MWRCCWICWCSYSISPSHPAREILGVCHCKASSSSFSVYDLRVILLAASAGHDQKGYFCIQTLLQTPPFTRYTLQHVIGYYQDARDFFHIRLQDSVVPVDPWRRSCIRSWGCMIGVHQQQGLDPETRWLKQSGEHPSKPIANCSERRQPIHFVSSDCSLYVLTTRELVRSLERFSAGGTWSLMTH